jgi:2-iminobutanoate/2-iminopropanoate deaminase
MKTVIAAPDAPAAVGPYSQAIAVGNLLFCAGQIPLDPATGELVAGGVPEQATRVCENIAAVLRANGMDFSHVVKATVFMVNLADFAAMNEVYARYFTAPFPARSTIQVAALPKGAQVEIEVIAVRSEGARANELRESVLGGSPTPDPLLEP